LLRELHGLHCRRLHRVRRELLHSHERIHTCSLRARITSVAAA
jgi:hypothetical protein